MKFDLEQTKRRLLVKYPMFGSDLANVTFVENAHIDTLGTDGKVIYYNEAFVNQCSEDQQTFLLAHEISHVAFRHIERSKGKDPYLWNVATDAVINAFLKKDALEMVESGVDMPEALHYDAETFYEKLLEEQKQKQAESGSSSMEQEGQGKSMSDATSQNSQQNSSSDADMQNGTNGDELDKQQDVGHATHQLWGTAQEMEQAETGTMEQSSPSSSKKKSSIWDRLFKREQADEQNDEISSMEADCQAEEKQSSEDLAKLGEKEAFQQNAVERKKQLEELKNALVQQASGYGATTDAAKRDVDGIGIAKPLIEWRRLLRAAIKYDLDWSYQNASIENGVVLPHLETFPRPETEILLDTSGSIDTVLLRNFLRECKNILQTSKVFVGCFDTEFYGFQEIRTPLDIDRMQFHGGGGTDFDVAVQAFTRRVENKIIFTDGEARMPETAMNAIWVVFGDRSIQPKGGRVIPITTEELRRLQYVKSYPTEKAKVKTYHFR